MSNRIVRAAEVLVSGFDTPEGPAFDRDGNLYWVNWNSASIMRRTPAGEVKEVYNTGGIPAGLAFDKGGWLYIADEGKDIHGIIRVRPDGTEASILVNECDGQPLNGANDLVFAADGTIYFSDPWGSNGDIPIGGFYRYLPSGTIERIDSGLCFPNGVGISPDGRYVYLAETFRNRILRYEIRADGTMGAREHWADTPIPSGPDGMAVDVDGNVYSAHFHGAGVFVYAPSGERIDHIAVPGNETTNCCFGGPGMRTMIVTDVTAQALFTLELNVTGLPLHDNRVY
jgi:gluconolactonase